ncbi:MAG TPA: hypothetical protein VFO46_13225 [Candidatus Sulfotelmatobacter sp.]|nr:hypothetical protein [Candidatus Sulfotelmatobacter sp.]
MELRLYLKAIGKHWWALLSCAAFTIIAVGGSLAGKSDSWITKASIFLAMILLLVAGFLAWRDEHRELEKERAKNEAAPKMDIRPHNVISYSQDQATATDLFVYVELVLGEPSHVLIESFSLDISDQGECTTTNALEDVREWQWIRKGTLKDGIVDCEPLAKELAKRGDPVRGWIHFPMPCVPDRVLQRSLLTLNVNCAHGTCYFGIDAARMQHDLDVKGLIWRRPKAHETT